MRLAPRSGSTLGLIGKLIMLGLAVAIAIWGAVPLINAKNWIALAILIVATLAMLYIYLTPKFIPAKYLFFGTIFLLALQVTPVIYTVSIAFTNFGDGHRGTKQDAIVAIESASVTQAPGSEVYQLSIATDSDGALVFLLTDSTGAAFVGTQDGLTPLEPGTFTAGATGKITKADGYTVLNIGQASARSAEITTFSVPTPDGAIRSQGLSTAFEGIAGQNYEESCDCVTDTATGVVYTANNDTGEFVDPERQQVGTGLEGRGRLQELRRHLHQPGHHRIVLQDPAVEFRVRVVGAGLTFAMGLLLALVFNSDSLKGQRIYRSLLILPYAMPAFAMLLVWRDMFNRDFGLINNALGLNIDWFGQAWSARAAILIIQLWMGFPYMFLVCTGALQSIPADLVEAAGVDGAKPAKAFQTITFPLLLVATGPLLITTFAFNFNNFNAIYLTSGGGPFPVDNPSAGATDLLISYTYRLAFGGAGANYGFAAAVSILIFLIVAVISIIGFKRTKVLEEIN